MTRTPDAPSPALSRARDLTLFRRVGYALLPGNLFSYLLHLRPSEWGIMAAHTALGFLLATGFPPVGAGAPTGDVLLGLTLWVICLNGGTLALNSAFDNDEGDIGYLVAPPEPPRHLAVFAIALMAVGQLLALHLPPAFAVAYAICFVLSILYSLPPFRWKAVAGADWVINMWGFGTLTPFAGWAITGRPLEGWAALIFLSFCPLFAALYPLTQLYQFDEDRARGDRTLALVLGMRRSLQVAIGAVIAAFAILAAAVVVRRTSPASTLLAIPLLAWLGVLVPWYRRHATMSPADHQRGMYGALRAWAVTDLVVLVVFSL